MKRFILALALLFSTPAFAQQAPIMRPVSTYVLTPLLLTSAITSVAIPSQFNTVRLFSTVSAVFAIMPTPIILASSKPAPLAASEKEYFTVAPGEYIIVRSGGTAGGSLYITLMDR